MRGLENKTRCGIGRCTLLVAGAVASAGLAGAVEAGQIHGTLSYPSGSGSTAIDFMPANPSYGWGGDISSNNFVFDNFDVGESTVTLGLQASAHYGNPDGPTYVGDGTFQVNRGSGYVPGSPGSTPTSPKWGFQWNVTVDGNQPTGDDDIWFSLRIVGPGGDYGTLLGGLDASGTFGGVVPVYQGSNNLGDATYSSANEPFWSGLAFDPNQLGRYDFTLIAWNGDPTDGGSVVGTVAMGVEVVPGSGLAALGTAGLAGLARRRRSAC